MPCFNIHTVDHPEETHTAQRQLADVDAARRVAAEHLANLLIAAQPSVHEAELQVQVSDEQGIILFMITAFTTEAPAIKR
jgi:hypothetical protein